MVAASSTSTDHFARLSGQWTGFTNQGSPANKRRLDLLLQLRDHQLSGVGDDESGMFVLSGEFDAEAREFRWVQTYLFGSTLFCRGFCEDDRIWGTWQDATEGHGGFQIWPLSGTNEGGEKTVSSRNLRGRGSGGSPGSGG